MIGFVIRLGVVGAVLLYLVSPERAADGDPAAEAQGGIGSLAHVIGAAVSDAAGFCARHPTACDEAARLAETFGRKVAAGASAVVHHVQGQTDAGGATAEAAFAHTAPDERDDTATRPAGLLADERAIDWRLPRD